MIRNYFPVVKNIVIHLGFWMFWLLVPILFSMADGREHPPLQADYFFRTFLTMALFYFNYLWFIEKTLFKRRIRRFVFVNLVLLIALTALSISSHKHFAIVTVRLDQLGPEQTVRIFKDVDTDTEMVAPAESFGGREFRMPSRPPLFVMLAGTFFSYLFAISISITIKATTRWFVMDAQRKTLENEHLKSELNNLKLQLNPHFFFNTLNNIYALIQLNQEKAQDAVHRLAKLMRYHLYETNAERVSLRGELEFLESYVSLMKMRSTSMVEVNFKYHLENEGTLIAPLLFVPLVENAFKYGISNDYKSFITIDIQEKNHELCALFENTVFINPDAIAGHSGIGLENLKKRLSLIYPGSHVIKTTQNDHQFVVHLNILLT